MGVYFSKFLRILMPFGELHLHLWIRRRRCDRHAAPLLRRAAVSMKKNPVAAANFRTSATGFP